MKAGQKKSVHVGTQIKPQIDNTTRDAGCHAKTEIDYNIIGSGSSGNAVRIENIMFDCGMPFSKMKEDLYKVDALLLTHSHADHIKPATFNSIRKEFPHIKVYGNPHTAYQYEVDKVIGTTPFKVKGMKIVPFEGVHDIPVTGYILCIGDLNVLYMTDTSKVPMPEGYPLDYVFLESNYDEKKLQMTAKQYARRGYDPYESVFRHLSTQKCKEFYFVNRRSKDSVLIELHKSRRFY